MLKQKKSQWEDLKTVILVVIVIIVGVIIIRNFIFKPVADASQCSGIGGECMLEKCSADYFKVPGIDCGAGKVCCRTTAGNTESSPAQPAQPKAAGAAGK